MSSSLNPTIQSLILHMRSMIEGPNLKSSWQKHKFCLERQNYGQIKGRVRAMSLILYPTIQQVIVHVKIQNFKILA